MDNNQDIIMNTPDNTGYLKTVAKLCNTSKFLLAIKAYERALLDADEISDTNVTSLEISELVPKDLLFKDFVLHCNAFSVKTFTTDINISKDFLKLCLEQLEKQNCLQYNLENDNEINEVIVSNQNDKSIIFLVAITLNNWACLLLQSGEIEKAAVFLQAALNVSIVPELNHIILLNICALHIRNCCFPETKVTAMEVFRENKKENFEESKNICSNTNTKEDVKRLLFSLAYHNLGIAEEYMTPNEADNFYNLAKETIAESPYQQWSKIIENSQRRFNAILQRRREEAVKKREMAEAEMEAARIAEVSNRRKGKNIKQATSTTTTTAAAAGTGVGAARASRTSIKVLNQSKKFKKRISNSAGEIKDEPIELPPIGGQLRWQIRTKGLIGEIVPILNIAEVENLIFNMENQNFESPFSIIDGISLSNIAMICLYEETPLQIADEVELKDNEIPLRRTVWSLFAPRHDDIIITPEVKPKIGVVLPSSALKASKYFMPPPISEKAFEVAQRGVAALKKMLNHRLTTLLKVENAFEEKWKATTIVKNALVAFNFVQDVIKLKATIKEKKKKQMILENASAKRIVRFFRKIIESKNSTEGMIPREVRVKHFEEKSVITLQKYARRWLAKRELQRLKDERQAEIKKIIKVQSLYRSRMARNFYILYKNERLKEFEIQKEKEKKEIAATQIQQLYRRHFYQLCKWRDEGQIKKFILHHYKFSRNYYATLIQKVFRGYLVRCIYGSEVYKRRCYGRNYYRAIMLNNAATIIQSTFRGYLTRKATKIPLQNYFLQCSQEKDKLEKQYYHDAALVIQCAYRCYKARKIISELKELRSKERLLRRNRVYPSFRLEEQVY